MEHSLDGRRRSVTSIPRGARNTRSDLLVNALEPLLAGEKTGQTYAQLAKALNLAAGSVKAEVHRLRRRYRTLLRLEIAHTVSTPDQVSDELRALMAAVSG